VIQEPVRCVEFVELVTDWMEDALDDEVRNHVEEHLAICPHCTEYVDQLRETTRMLAELGEEAPPPGRRDELLDAFRRLRS
jgi:predicted anti-sigma-YlaC factor YlaD